MQITMISTYLVITVIWDGAKTSVLSPILHNVLSPFTTVILDSISVNISLYLENALNNNCWVCVPQKNSKSTMAHGEIRKGAVYIS